MMRCPGCFKIEQTTFCGACRKRLFDGKKVPFVLPFSRPAYDKARLEFTPDRLSISGIQTKISLTLNKRRSEMVESGGRYILKPRPHGVFSRLDIAPVNEHLTMQIARQVFDIETADNALVAFDDEPPRTWFAGSMFSRAGSACSRKILRKSPVGQKKLTARATSTISRTRRLAS